MDKSTDAPPEQFVNFSIDNWPLVDVLHGLADGAEHLLRDHDCDAHGWEGLSYAVVAAKIHARDLEARALSAPSAPTGQGEAAQLAASVDNERALALRIVELERERDALRMHSIFAPNSCSVCGGAPLASGRECICGGKGTTHAEMDGLRQELFTIENRATPAAPDKGEVARRVTNALVKSGWLRTGDGSGPSSAAVAAIASIIEAELG